MFPLGNVAYKTIFFFCFRDNLLLLFQEGYSVTRYIMNVKTLHCKCKNQKIHFEYLKNKCFDVFQGKCIIIIDGTSVLCFYFLCFYCNFQCSNSVVELNMIMMSFRVCLFSGISIMLSASKYHAAKTDNQDTQPRYTTL